MAVPTHSTSSSTPCGRGAAARQVRLKVGLARYLAGHRDGAMVPCTSLFAHVAVLCFLAASACPLLLPPHPLLSASRGVPCTFTGVRYAAV